MQLTNRQIGQKLHKVLEKGQLLPLMEFIKKTPPKKLITPLIRAFYNEDSIQRWLAIIAFGKVVATIAQNDLEQARIIIRRLMWSLNDESGGIGWGAPEAMAEAMANSKELATEYSKILLSYVWEEGNFLEYLPLRRGALWGLYRLAESHPEIFREIQAENILEKYLSDQDPQSKALAIIAISLGGNKKFCNQIADNLSDNRSVKLFIENELKKVSISELSKKALKKLNC